MMIFTIPPNIYHYLKWFYAPKNVTILNGVCLFMVSVVLVGFMGAYFSNVIVENRLINETPMFKMVTEANRFMEDMHADVSRDKLLKDYQWLHQLDTLINSDCDIIPVSLKYLLYTGYVMAAYNIFLIHILLHDILPFWVFASIPIAISLISSNIDPWSIIQLGVFEFSQPLLSMAIIITFISLNETTTRSQSILESEHEG